MNIQDQDAVLRTAALARISASPLQGEATFAPHFGHLPIWHNEEECRIEGVLPTALAPLKRVKTRRVESIDHLESLVVRLLEAECEPLRAEIRSLRAQVAELNARVPVSRQLSEWQVDLIKRAFSSEQWENVLQFVADRELTDLLAEAAQRIQTRFGEATALALEVRGDRLAVAITTDLAIDDACDRLREIEYGWWVKARGDRLFVSLTLDFA